MGHSSRSSSTSKKPFQTFKAFTPSQLTTSTTRMKYAFAILMLACAVAAAKTCLSDDDVEDIFDGVDTNDDGEICRSELVAALKAFAKSRDYEPTKGDWAWVKKTATEAAGKDRTLNVKEFGRWVNKFAEHFHLCD